MDLNGYLDAATKRLGLQSDRRLSLALALSPITVSTFRTGRALPSDETMVRLAELAGIDPATALIDLGCWRSAARKEPKAAEVYEKMRAALLKGAAAAIALYVAAAAASSPAMATDREQIRSDFPELYIMR